MLSSSILDTTEAIDAHLGEWDRLAVASRRPLAAPAFGLGWLWHCAPSRSRPDRQVVNDGERVIGIAPYLAQRGRAGRTDYRLLGSGTFHRIGPLAEEGAERAVAAAVGLALHGATPAPSLVTLEGTATPDWLALLAETYPGRLRPRLYVSSVHGAPVVHLGSRTDVRRLARRQEQQLPPAGTQRPPPCRRAGCALPPRHRSNAGRRPRLVRASAPPALGRDAQRDSLERSRRPCACRGRNGARPSPPLPAVARRGGRHAGRSASLRGSWWRACLLERRLRPAFAKLAPGFLLMLRAVEDACSLGVSRIDLGGGEHHYKLHLRRTGTIQSPGAASCPARDATPPSARKCSPSSRGLGGGSRSDCFAATASASLFSASRGAA